MGALWGPNLRTKWTIHQMIQSSFWCFEKCVSFSRMSYLDFRTCVWSSANFFEDNTRLIVLSFLIASCFSEPIVFLQRKDTGNERGYFSKSFAEYVEGFEANGTSQTFQSVLNPIILRTSITSVNYKKVKSGWALTSCMNWRPRIPLDWRLSWLILTQHNTSPITASSRSSVKFIDSIILPCIQVGSAEGYQLTVTGFSPSSSTLHDGMKHNNGMNFTTLWELLNDCFFTHWFFFEKSLERTRILDNLQMTNDTDQLKWQTAGDDLVAGTPNKTNDKLH